MPVVRPRATGSSFLWPNVFEYSKYSQNKSSVEYQVYESSVKCPLVLVQDGLPVLGAGATGFGALDEPGAGGGPFGGGGAPFFPFGAIANKLLRGASRADVRRLRTFYGTVKAW